jgi:hypothetical protein
VAENVTTRPDPERPCPFCGQPVKEWATRCRHCGESFEEDEDEGPRPVRSVRRVRRNDEGLEWLVPINRSVWAIAAGYLGLVSCIPFIGILFGSGAILTGVLALSSLKKDPELGGRGRAIFGIVMGGLGLVFSIIVTLVIVLDQFKLLR